MKRTNRLQNRASMILAALACLTFVASWFGWFAPSLVEAIYARRIFPAISRVARWPADTVPFSWLDLWIVCVVVILSCCIVRRRLWLAVGTVSFFYLVFFWGWGLNYHRPPLSERLHLQAKEIPAEERARFADQATRELNRLWPMVSTAPLTWDEAGERAAARVARVVSRIDDAEGPAPARLKHSVLAGPWYRIAGIDGMFNPFGHEPLVVSGLLPFETPFLMAHELAHVRGVANEGEANLIALLATLASDDARFQYSGWLHLWGYVARDATVRLDPGPRRDLSAIRERLLRNEIAWVSDLQSAILDTHLKANAVPAGIHSYSEFVALAIATEPRWPEFQ